MKRLTLRDAWKYCIQQWQWVIVQIIMGSRKSVYTLKTQWCREHDFWYIINTCFFCHYDDQFDSDCSHCPGKLVDPEFDCTTNDSYHYTDEPINFFLKIKQLRKIYNAR